MTSSSSSSLERPLATTTAARAAALLLLVALHFSAVASSTPAHSLCFSFFAGGGASDRLRGGTGKDTFVFDTALDGLNNVDLILDYTVADDRIWLDADVFAGFAATGRIANAAFTTGTEATTAAHRIIYNAANGMILYDADGAGGADAIAFARVSAGLAMSGAEFIVV